MLTYKKSGIYSIKNLVTNTVYIGSTFNLSERKATHFYQLRNGTHCNPYLQRSFLKHGEKNFIFEVLMYCDKSELRKHEQSFLDLYKSEKIKTYNIRKHVEDNTGYKHTKESIDKIRKTFKERGVNKGEKNGMYGMSGDKNPFYNKTHSEEMRKSISERNKGKFTKEDNPFFGKHHSEELKKKMSLARSGENSSFAKLTKNDVIEIRELLNKNISIKSIAEMFNVGSHAIYDIKNHKTWKHV